MKWLSGFFTRLVNSFSRFSWILRTGLIIFVISGTLDLFYHTVSLFSPGMLDPFLGPDGYYVHRALFAGMVLMVIGVLQTKPASDPGSRFVHRTNKINNIVHEEANP